MFEEFLTDNQIERKLSIETSNYNSSIEYAKKGLGIALIPKNMINDELDRMIHQYEENLKMQGITLEQFYQFTNSNEDT